MNRRKFSKTTIRIAIAMVLVFVGGCKDGTTHRHNWMDGKCTECGKECEHQWNIDGKCNVCGTRCPHEWDQAPSGEERCRKCGVYKEHYKKD
ncbi:MAG: hypothetical protein KatS3mg109_0302 [Pirellulaceae bacterium]|nr:MAG: hypothetical protein KatS3mg109_0302 [Pirellulaceae bacterium]